MGEVGLKWELVGDDTARGDRSGEIAQLGLCPPPTPARPLPHSQLSMSAEASFPEGPKWMRMNLPCSRGACLLRASTARALPAADPSPPTATHTLTVPTHKARRVVIPQSLGIAKSLHGRVSLDDLILQGTLVAAGMRGQGSPWNLWL